LFSHRFV